MDPELVPIPQPETKPAHQLLLPPLLIVVLILAATSGFLAYQNLKLQKQIVSLQIIPISPSPLISPSPSSSPTISPTTISYHGSNVNGERFTLNIPKECVQTSLIECKNKNFIIIIDPQAPGRDTSPFDVIKRINLNGIYWDRLILTNNIDTTASYGFQAKNDYYLIGVEYKPYSVEAQNYFEQILSTFKFIRNTSMSCQSNGKTYQNGETFPDKCNSCTCENGQIACTLMACQ